MNNVIRIEFPPDREGRLDRKEGLLTAEVNLGAYREAVKCDVSEWDKNTYERHWRQSFNALVQKRSIVMFCSSMAKASVDLWVAGIRYDSVEIINILAKRADVSIEGEILRSRKVEELYSGIIDEEGVSKWEISKAHLER